MASLPPYSTYRTDSKQMPFPQATSHGSLNVKFPDSRLAVCLKCKKNFKTRDMCRVRNNHTEPPWTTSYICITLDESCTDDEGKYVDKPLTVRMVQWQPFCVKHSFEPKTPVCAGCKKTNRTRQFCRERHRHRQLPWCTVYVLLSALDTADPSTVVAGSSKPVGGDGESHEDKKAAASPASVAESKTSESYDGENVKPDNSLGDAGDDIHDISPSRTFLAKVSSEGTSLHWLELAEYDSNFDPNPPTAAALQDTAMYAMHPSAAGAGSKTSDPNRAAHYYHGYAHHQGQGQQSQQYYYQVQQHPHYAQGSMQAWQGHYAQGYHPAPGTHLQNAPSPQDDESPPPGPPAPVTAGEAAAQQSKRRRDGAESAHSPSHPPHYMMYQHLYPPHPHSHYPSHAGPHPSTPEGREQHQYQQQQPSQEPSTPEDTGKSHNDDNDDDERLKRQRLS